MYRKRAFDLVTINTNAPADAPAVLDFLKKEYASSPNKQFATADRAALQAAWGEKWNLAAPLTMVIAPGGEVLYKKEGKIDILEVRRIILAAMPDTKGLHRLEGLLDEGRWQQARRRSESGYFEIPGAGGFRPRPLTGPQDDVGRQADGLEARHQRLRRLRRRDPPPGT